MKKLGLLIIIIVVCGSYSMTEPLHPTVLCEEKVTTYTPPNNGAGPLWCYGAPLMVRMGDRIFLSIMETGENAKPYCNTRWQLFERTPNGWIMRQNEEKFDQREPCPLAALSDDELILSNQPEVRRRSDRPDEKGSYCENNLLHFSLTDLAIAPQVLQPAWPEDAVFYEHSYRGLATYRPTHEILLFSAIDRQGDQLCLYRDGQNKWTTSGFVHFPVRGCYAQAAVRNQSAHMMAVGDIVEPVREWWDYKKEKTGNSWDYVFRRLFYTWTPDIVHEPFGEALEIDNVDATAGHIQNLDLWLGDNNTVFLLYNCRPIASELLRDRFFPHMKMTVSMHCVEIQQGHIQRRMMLSRGGEGLDDPQPLYGRFQSTPDGNLYVVASEPGRNWIQQIHPILGERITIPLKQPFTTFFTATERGGSNPSEFLDLFGYGKETNTLSYACVKLR